MPTRKNKPRATATAVPNEECTLCCKAIVEGEEEALLCEGDGSCNKWMHRYCAGVSTSHYEFLVKSPLPFNCSLCVQKKQAAMIEEMKSTIAALTAEVSELRTALQATTVTSEPGSGDSSTVWSKVVRRGRAHTHSRSYPGKPNGNKLRSDQTASRVSGKSNNNTNVSHEKHEQSARITVPGVRTVSYTHLTLPTIYSV